MAELGHLLDDSTSVSKWRATQRADPVIGPIFPSVAHNKSPGRYKFRCPAPVRRLLARLAIWSCYVGVLYRVTAGDDQPRIHLLLTKKYKEQVLKSLHDDVGHQGEEPYTGPGTGQIQSSGLE